MNKLLITITVLLIALPFNIGNAGIIIDTSQNNRLTNGLVGLWSFNGLDVAGVKAFDRSGNGNDGVMTNGPTLSLGKVGQGLNFDGSNDYVSTTDMADSSANISISAWINGRSFAGATAGINTIIGKEYISNDSFIFRVGDAGISQNRMQWVITQSNGTQIKLNGALLNTNQWYHVVATYDTSGRQAIYIDGALDVSQNTADGTMRNSTIALEIGRSNNDNGRVWNGFIDEVRVYSRALTASQVKNLYLLGRSGLNSSQANKSTAGLAGNWTFDADDVAGVRAYDRSGNGNTGTMTNGPTLSLGKIGQGLSFDGSNDYVDLGNSASLQFGGAFTISLWIKTKALNSTQQTSFITKSVWNTSGWIISDNGQWSTNVFFRLHPGSSGNCGTNMACFSRNLVNDNKWHNITGVNTGSSLLLYLDGVLKDSRTSTGFTVNTANNATISDSGTPVNGSMDEVRIYTRALTPSEVKNLYLLGRGGLNSPQTSKLTSGLAGIWTFNGPDVAGVRAYDRSGNGNTGAMTNGPTLSLGKIGQGLNFDGSNDYVDLGNPSALNLASANRFTLSAWVYFTGGNDVEAGIISEDFSRINPPGSTVQYEIGLDMDQAAGGGQSRLAVGFYNGAWRIVRQSTSFTTNRWIHITGTWDGTTLILYRDGVQVTSGAPGGSLPSTGVEGFYVGQRHDAIGTANFKGSIDEVRIYNRALTPSEVKQLYNMGR